MFGLPKLYLYIAAAVAIAGAAWWAVSTIKQSGIDEANLTCSMNAIEEAETARNEVEKVKAEAQAEAEKDKEIRERQYNEDAKRADQEQAARDAKIADLRSLMQKSSPQCQEWRKQVFACKPE
jgi:dipeptidase